MLPDVVEGTPRDRGQTSRRELAATGRQDVPDALRGRGTVDGIRTASSLLPEFEASLPAARVPVMAIAEARRKASRNGVRQETSGGVARQ
jgi:hypothetical protein